MKKHKKSYNPFKMWGSWIGAIILIALFSTQTAGYYYFQGGTLNCELGKAFPIQSGLNGVDWANNLNSLKESSLFVTTRTIQMDIPQSEWSSIANVYVNQRVSGQLNECELSVRNFKNTPDLIMVFLMQGSIGFLIGWIINSLWRKFR